MKKLIATFLIAIMTILPTVLAATPLGTFPGFLGSAGTLDAYVVVGSDALVEDVVGAADIAIRLAETSYTAQTLPGVSACVDNCVEKEVSIGATDISSSTYFGPSLKQVRIAYLKDASFDVGGESKRYYEQIMVPTASISNDYTAYNESAALALTDGGTPWEYRLVFAEGFNMTDGSYDNTNPLTLELMGKTFGIIAFGDDTFTAQIGDQIDLDYNVPVTKGDFTYTLTLGSNTLAVISVTGPGVPSGYSASLTPGQERTITGTDMKIKLVSVNEFTVLNTIRATIIVGSETQKTFSTGDEWPDSDQWKFSLTINQGSGDDVTASDYIGVQYIPTVDEGKYIKPSQKLASPNDYVEILNDGYTVSKYAGLTIEPKSSVTIYDDAEKAISGLSGKNGFKISSDQKILGLGYKTAYIVFNKTGSDVTATLAYEDPSKSNKPIFVSSQLIISTSATDDMTVDVNFEDSSKYTIVLVHDENDYNVSSTFPTIQLLGMNTAGFNDVNVTGNFHFTSSLTVKLGETASTAEAADVVLVGPSDSIGEQESGIIYDKWGTIIKDVSTNADSDKLVFSIPVEQVKVKVAIGKPGATSTGGTYNIIKKFNYRPLAKLASEITSTERASNLVIVGGPCVNSLAAEVLGLTYKTCGTAALTAMGITAGQALIKNYDQTSGKVYLLVAGAEAADTRLATSALQLDKLAANTNSAVIISGSIVSPVITPA